MRGEKRKNIERNEWQGGKEMEQGNDT